MKKYINKDLIVNILIPLILGAIIGFISNTNDYKFLIKPSFSPSGIIFPIVWSILYILMGVSNYLTNNITKIYKCQLVINLFWPILFFNFKLYFISLLWLILLIIFVIKMIISFYSIKKEAAFINIPYLFWLLFALYLNFGVYLLN